MKKRILALVLALAVVAALTGEALASVPCAWCWGKNGNCIFCGGTGRQGSDPTAAKTTKPDPGGVSSSSAQKADISISALVLVAGRTAQLKVTGTTKKVKWSSSNKKVATVSSKGKVKAKKNGKCTITAKVGSKKLKCKVTVKKKTYAKSIKLDKTKATLLPGGSIDLTYTVSPEPSKITEEWKVSFSSGKEGVATVDRFGKVTGRNPGKATITAKLKIKKGKYKKYKCAITVESGLTRFKRWFDKNSESVDGVRIYYSGLNDEIIYDPSAKTWTFQRYETSGDGSSRSESVETSVTFNENFTGKVYLSYHRLFIGAFGGKDEVEGTAVESVKTLSNSAGYNWNYTQGKDKTNLANTSVHALMSSMHLLLKREAKLNARVGWYDLGLKAY